MKKSDLLKQLKVISKSKNALTKAYFLILIRAIQIDLERVHNEPKINVLEYMLSHWDSSLDEKAQMSYWYDINNPVRNIIELENDKIFDGWSFNKKERLLKSNDKKPKMDVKAVFDFINLQTKYNINQRIAAKLFRDGYNAESLHTLFYKGECNVNSVYTCNIYNAMLGICSGTLDVNKIPEL